MGIHYIMVAASFELVAVTPPWGLTVKWVLLPSLICIKKKTTRRVVFFLEQDTGVESDHNC